MIKLKSELVPRPRRPSRRAVILGAILLALFLLVLGLLVERWRGQYALSRWKDRMTSQGEIFEAGRLWPQPTAQSRAFSNQLRQAIGQLPAGFSRYAGLMSGIVVQEPGLARRGSQEPSPVLNPSRDGTDTWEDLARQIRLAQPALQSLRRILSTPPLDLGYDVVGTLKKFGTTHFVPIRSAAQALQAAALSDVHRGDLTGAKDNLVALAGFQKLYADDPTLVTYMMRVAVLGLSIDTAWDALQAEGWTDAQLEELQRAFQGDDLLAQLPRANEAERAWRLFEYHWFSSHSYLAWVARYQPILQAFGQDTPASPQVLATRYFREWVSHPLWRFAWADQEQMEYLKTAQRELDVLRGAVKIGSWKRLNRDVDSIQRAYRAPVASWRFYLQLPLPDQVIYPRDDKQYPGPNFTRAWFTSMKNMTLGQMVTAAIAVKRYEARHGKVPVNLETLVPEFLAQVPLDYMDGQPLRYKIRPDGSACLYSVGEDTEDNQSDPTPQTSERQQPSAWDGRDWVWPRVASSQ